MPILLPREDPARVLGRRLLKNLACLDHRPVSAIKIVEVSLLLNDGVSVEYRVLTI